MDKIGRCAFLCARNPEEGPWNLLRREDVPNWVTTSSVLTELINGNMCQDKVEGDNLWYRVEVLC